MYLIKIIFNLLFFFLKKKKKKSFLLHFNLNLFKLTLTLIQSPNQILIIQNPQHNKHTPNYQIHAAKKYSPSLKACIVLSHSQIKHFHQIIIMYFNIILLTI